VLEGCDLMDLLNAGRKFWQGAVLQIYFAVMFALKYMTAGEYAALALPVFFAFCGANVAQKFANPKEVTP
jgi:hypothetical protein